MFMASPPAMIYRHSKFPISPVWARKSWERDCKSWQVPLNGGDKTGWMDGNGEREWAAHERCSACMETWWGREAWRKLLWEWDNGKGSSGRVERTWVRVGKVRREENKEDMITKEKARKKTSHREGRNRECWADKEENEHGVKTGSGRTEEEREREREERIEWMLTGSPNSLLRLYPSQAEEQQSQTHFLSPWP